MQTFVLSYFGNLLNLFARNLTILFGNTDLKAGRERATSKEMHYIILGTLFA